MKRTSRIAAAVSAFVMAFSAMGFLPAESPFSAEVSVSAAEYNDSVSGFTYKSDTNSIELYWKKLSSAYSYRVEQKNSKGEYEKSEYKLTKTKDGKIKATITGLSKNKKYTFKVTPLKKSGSSYVKGKAKTVSVSTAENSISSKYNGAITDVNVITKTSDTITLSWKEVKDADGYSVKCKAGAMGKYKNADCTLTVSNGTVTAVVKGLVSSLTYSIWVTPLKEINGKYYSGKTYTISVKTESKSTTSKTSSEALPLPTSANSTFVYYTSSENGMAYISYDTDCITDYFKYLVRKGYSYELYKEDYSSASAYWKVYKGGKYVGLVSYTILPSGAYSIIIPKN